METSYKYGLAQFKNGKASSDRLSQEIQSSDILIGLKRIDTFSNIVDIIFKSELSHGEVEILNIIVSNHSGEPLMNPPEIIRAEVLTEHIKFIESGNTTQTLFAARSLVVDISAGETEKATDFSFPYPVALMSGTFGITDDMVGDEINIHIAPNTLIGVLILPLSVGDTSIYCSPTVFQNIKIGYSFGLYNAGGDTGVELGQVIYKDESNSVLVIDTPSTVSANAGSYVSMCAKIIPYLYLSSADKIEIGKDIPTGQRIPANLPIRVNYFNNNGIGKKISFFIEYLY